MQSKGGDVLKEKVKQRLKSFGYKFKDGDETILEFCIQKTEWSIKNECNIAAIPEGLVFIAIDMAAGEFFKAKKTFTPGDITALDLDMAVKQIQAGDTNVVFAAGESSLTPEQRFDSFINYLLTYGRGEFSCYRKIRW